MLEAVVAQAEAQGGPVERLHLVLQVEGEVGGRVVAIQVDDGRGAFVEARLMSAEIPAQVAAADQALALAERSGPA